MLSKNPCARGSALAIASLLLGSGLMQACASTSASPFVVALPNGHYLQRDRDSHIGLIQRGGKQIIRGPIAAYAVDRDIVAGCIGEWPRRAFSYPNETPYPDSPDCRYFIFHTATGEVEKDLDPKTWRARLKDAGSRESLQITAPVLPR
jgi:hypothetical protein